MEEKQLQAAVYSLDRHKATDLLALRVAELSTVADYFLLASGSGATQVRALADYLEEELAREGLTPSHIEGYDSGSWILLDYGDMIVHIFREETRAFYDLERLWTDASRVDIEAYKVPQERNDDNQ